MNFRFSRQGLSRKEWRLERFFQALPGSASWTILLGMLVLTFWKPLEAAILILAFDLYWLMRLLYMTLFLVLASLRLGIERHTDWITRMRGLDSLEEYKSAVFHAQAPVNWKRRISHWLHKRELSFVRTDLSRPLSDEVYHLVIIPVAKELPSILKPGIQSLRQQTFPTSRMLVVFAVEEWAPRDVYEGIALIQKLYRDDFMDLLVIAHPEGLIGEAKVKGANASFAAKKAADYFSKKGVSLENIIVSCFDADTVVGPEYFGCLTYNFLLHPNRTRSSFQPIPVFHNNIWEAPEFTRILDIGSSFFQLVEATNPEKLVTFSSHSMSFKALVDVGFWPVDMISDDSAIFWKTFIHYDGDYQVVPLYVTLSMDAVNAGSWWRTVVNVYRQKRRWAWGVENFPIVARAFLRAKKIPLWTRIRHTFKLFESHVSWASWAFLLTFIGWLPVLFAGREFSNSVLYYSAPKITGIIFHISALSLLVTILLSLALLPKPKVRYPLLQRMIHAVEWLSIPVVATLLSALPALDAQTRLMSGRYMEFWVTEKSRRLKRSSAQEAIVSGGKNTYDDVAVSSEKL